MASDRSGSEKELLTRFLDDQRDAILRKTAQLTRDQLAQTLPPSTMTLGGLLNHLALVEESWMEVRFSGLPEREPWTGVDWDADPDWEWHTAKDFEPIELRQRYTDACERSRQVVDQASSLDQMSKQPARPGGGPFSLRWVLLHLIEETARHAGHADLLRESIDGKVGE